MSLFPQPERVTWIETKFSEKDIYAATQKWGCNCGPAALAAMTNLTPDQVLPHLPDFEERRYTNPSMMQAALRSMGICYREMDDAPDRKLLSPSMAFPEYGLVRIQWHGPWLGDGVPPAAAYRYTHWIGTMLLKKLPENVQPFDCVYDINGGWHTRPEWEGVTAPDLARTYSRATAGWHPTHRWELDL